MTTMQTRQTAAQEAADELRDVIAHDRGKRWFGDRWAVPGASRSTAFAELGLSIPGDAQREAEVALRLAGVDYAYERWPVTARGGAGTVFPQGIETEIVLKDKVAVVRQPTLYDQEWRSFGVFDAKYQVLQPLEMARTLVQPLIDATGWPVAFAGAVDKGAKTFLALRAPSYAIGKSELDRYLLVSDGYDGAMALRVALVDIRLFCTNQLEAAFSGAGARVTIAHSAKLREDAKLFGQIMAGITRIAERQSLAFGVLAATRVNREETQLIVDAAYPAPPPPRRLQSVAAYVAHAEQTGVYVDDAVRAARQEQTRQYELARARQAQFREAALEAALPRFLSETGEDVTAWAVYNAVAEVADNRLGRQAAASTLFGERAQERARAFRMAAELAGIEN